MKTKQLIRTPWIGAIILITAALVSCGKGDIPSPPPPKGGDTTPVKAAASFTQNPYMVQTAIYNGQSGEGRFGAIANSVTVTNSSGVSVPVTKIDANTYKFSTGPLTNRETYTIILTGEDGKQAPPKTVDQEVYTVYRSNLCWLTYQWSNYFAQKCRLDASGNPIPGTYSNLTLDPNKHTYNPDGTGMAITPSGGQYNQTYGMQGPNESQFISGPGDIWNITTLVSSPAHNWEMYQDKVDPVTGFTWRTTVKYN